VLTRVELETVQVTVTGLFRVPMKYMQTGESVQSAEFR